MNLWFRMLWLLMTFWRGEKLTSARQPSMLRSRVWLTDIDFNIHLTNGRYLAIADLGRTDLALRTGLYKGVLKQGWAPIVSYSSVMFRRELRLWQRFELSSQLCYWDDEVQVFEHVFRPLGGQHDGQIAAVILCVAAMYDRRKGAFVSAADLFASIGVQEDSPPKTARLARFIESYRAFRTETHPVRTVQTNDSASPP